MFSRQWAIYSGLLYDLTDYIYTLKQQSDATSTYSFLDSDIVDIFKQQAGQDITKALNAVLSGKDADTVGKNIQCLKDAFSWGGVDFRKSARCQVQNYLLLIFSGVLMASMLLKCMFLRLFLLAVWH